ncbi:MAG: hypothetical protein AAF958_13405 [Planctomycetota bacterium]
MAEPAVAWLAAQSWQRLDAEYRSNYLRIASVLAFFVIHLVDHYLRGTTYAGVMPSPRGYHLAITLIVATWLMLALLVDLFLKQRKFPPWTAYATVTLDTLLLASVLAVAGGQSSMLNLAYCLILVMAALRLDLVLVRYTTFLCMAAYLSLGCLAYLGSRLGTLVEPAATDSTSQAIAAIAIGAAGIMLGQLVRRCRNVADDYARRLLEPR